MKKEYICKGGCGQLVFGWQSGQICNNCTINELKNKRII
ncbi:hypothetical protein CCP3SC1AL1_510012 [Gammaproteobacteria bacterium]